MCRALRDRRSQGRFAAHEQRREVSTRRRRGSECDKPAQCERDGHGQRRAMHGETRALAATRRGTFARRAVTVLTACRDGPLLRARRGGARRRHLRRLVTNGRDVRFRQVGVTGRSRTHRSTRTGKRDGEPEHYRRPRPAQCSGSGWSQVHGMTGRRGRPGLSRWSCAIRYRGPVGRATKTATVSRIRYDRR